MAASIRNGKNFELVVDTRPVAWVTDFKIDQRFNTYDTTSFGDISKTFVAGLPTTTFELSGTFNGPFDSNVVNAFTGGGSIYFEPQVKTTNNTSEPIKEQPQMQLYEYAVLYVPEDDEGNVIKADAKILIQPSTKLATSEEQVRRAAMREYDDTGIDNDFVVVTVRPFGGR